ncbi:MAG: AAA family ATPase [Magnetococcales bacterium]|nr:AAA family ATPase [Magnetococcales bacterium]
MYALQEIDIKGFRRLRDVRLEMRPLTVLIGANGVGKSSLLDAMNLLSASAAGQLNVTLNKLLGGMADVCTRGQTGCIDLAVKLAAPGHSPWKYALSLETKGYSYRVAGEMLAQEPIQYMEAHLELIKYYDAQKKRLIKANWESNSLESALSQVHRTGKQLDDFRQILRADGQYRLLDVGRNAPVKLPQQMRPADSPGANGEDLVSFLFSLRETDRDRYERIEDTLKAAFPDFASLHFPPVAAGMLSMTWRESQCKDPLYIHQLSDGSIRFLWLISLLQSPALSTITLIDEPEVSLHPDMLRLLADLLREASLRTNLLVATHSDQLIRFLKPEEVVVLDKNEEGFTTAHRANTLDLEAWLADYSLDEIRRMGGPMEVRS